MIVSTREYEIPSQYQALYKRAITGKSRKDSVRAHCLMCCGWQENEVARCTATRCPLYLHRMGRRSSPAVGSSASEE